MPSFAVSVAPEQHLRHVYASRSSLLFIICCADRISSCAPNPRCIRNSLASWPVQRFYRPSASSQRRRAL